VLICFYRLQSVTLRFEQHSLINILWLFRNCFSVLSCNCLAINLITHFVVELGGTLHSFYQLNIPARHNRVIRPHGAEAAAEGNAWELLAPMLPLVLKAVGLCNIWAHCSLPGSISKACLNNAALSCNIKRNEHKRNVRNQTFEHFHDDDEGRSSGDSTRAACAGRGRTLSSARACFRSVVENAFKLRMDPNLPAPAV
jgi:hypothetical protein